MPWIGAIQKLVGSVGPWWLHTPEVAAWLESVALVIDGNLETLSQGLRQTQPLRCAVESLRVIARDRGIRLYPNEPTDSKRIRLSQWRQLHRQRATHQGELRHSQPYCLPDVPMMRIVHQAGDGSSATWHTLDGAGNYSVHESTPSNWNYDGVTWKPIATVNAASNTFPIAIGTVAPHGLVDGQPVQIAGVLGNTAANGTWKVSITGPSSFAIPATGNGAYTGGGSVSVNAWSRFWVILYLPASISALVRYDDGSMYDSDATYDGIALTQIASDLIAMISEWKSSHSRLWGYILATDPASFDPTATAVADAAGWTSLPVGNWGRPVSPSGTYTRPPSAMWIYDRGDV